jgi:hypothetical protein
MRSSASRATRVRLVRRLVAVTTLLAMVAGVVVWTQVSSADTRQRARAVATVSCPTVVDRLPRVPAAAARSVERQMMVMSQQVTAANRQLRGRPRGGADAVLEELRGQRVDALEEIADAIDRVGARPRGLRRLARCTLIPGRGQQPTTTTGAESPTTTTPVVSAPSPEAPAGPEAPPSAVPTHGTVFEVSPNGSDDGPCSSAQPCRTLARGVGALASGDTLLVHGGTYEETLIQTIPSGKSEAEPTTVMAAPGEEVRISSPEPVDAGIDITPGNKFIVVDGINVDCNRTILFGLGASKPSVGITMRNLEVKDCRGSGFLGDPDRSLFDNLTLHHNGENGFSHGIYFSGTNSTIQNSSVYSNAGYGIHHSLEAGGVVGNTIRNNRTWDNGSCGIIMNVGDNGLLYNNVVFENRSCGVQVGQDHTRVLHNTIVNNRGAGLDVGYNPNGEVKNNLIGGNEFDEIEVNNGTPMPAPGDNLIVSDPQLVDPEVGGDFRPKDGSPALAGTDPVAGVETDITGGQRGDTKVSFGAFEGAGAGGRTPS